MGERYKGIIFDLDNSILDTRSLGEDILTPVLSPLFSSDLSDETKEAIADALWYDAFEDVMQEFFVPDEISKEMREAEKRLNVPEGKIIKSFGDEECIRNLPVKRILVTSGFKSFQQSKIDKLGITDLFDEIIIDAVDDIKTRKGKKKIFEEILKTNRWNKDEVLVVGDNPKSELGKAKAIGITTVQTLRPGIKKWKEADHYIVSLCELKSYL